MTDARVSRREFLSRFALAASAVGASRRLLASPDADYTIRIAPTTLELAPGTHVRTIAYNGAVPGPLIKVRESVRATIDVVNDTDHEEFVHWHGLEIDPLVDGSMEEGTPGVPARGRRTYSFTPRPAGTRWYHSHAVAGHDLSRATYTGQFGFLIVEPAQHAGDYDAEILVAMHDWEPYIMGGDDGFQSVGYRHASINGRLLGAGDPVRVREGQRVLFRILNASASEAHGLALPGHRFTVLALDGNPVPTPATVGRLLLNPGERVDALVEMNQPGVWILGETRRRLRDMGLGVVIEYAGHVGKPQWGEPDQRPWTYTSFAGPTDTPVAPDDTAERLSLVFRSVFRGHGAFEHWSINGKSYPDTPVVSLAPGRRYRLSFENQSSEDHPLHLHRHTLELVSVAGEPAAGILKDVVTVPARSIVEADLVANNRGKSLFHCHLQDHMDAGFMMLFDYE